jgi:hypothetical protein
MLSEWEEQETLPWGSSANCYVVEHIGSCWTAAEEISSFFLRQFPLREVHAKLGIGSALEPVVTPTTKIIAFAGNK